MNLYNIKEFYRTHQLQDDRITPINRILLNYIHSLKPKNIFEFGCNQGKNLKWLEGKGYSNVYGIDIANISYPKSGWGDEETLKTFTNDSVDIAFTCSVLNHLPLDTVKSVIKNLKRMSRVVILGEITHEMDSIRWFLHDYEAMGFTKIDEIIQKPNDKLYGLYTSKGEE